MHVVYKTYGVCDGGPYISTNSFISLYFIARLKEDIITQETSPSTKNMKVNISRVILQGKVMYESDTI